MMKVGFEPTPFRTTELVSTIEDDEDDVIKEYP